MGHVLVAKEGRVLMSWEWDREINIDVGEIITLVLVVLIFIKVWF